MTALMHTEADLPAYGDRQYLPSGRTISVHVGASGEEIEVRAPGGEIELCVQLTPEGPVVICAARR